MNIDNHSYHTSQPTVATMTAQALISYGPHILRQRLVVQVLRAMPNARYICTEPLCKQSDGVRWRCYLPSKAALHEEGYGHHVVAIRDFLDPQQSAQ